MKQLVCCGTAKLLHKVAREATERVATDDSDRAEERKAANNRKRDNREEGEEGEDGTHPSIPWFRVVNTLKYPLLRYKADGTKSYPFVCVEADRSEDRNNVQAMRLWDLNRPLPR